MRHVSTKTTPLIEPRHASRFRSRLAWTAVAALVAATAALVWPRLAAVPAAPEVPPAAQRTALPLPSGVRFIVGRSASMAFSPDGRRIVIVAESGGTLQLYLRTLDSPDAVPIAGTDGASNPFFSPDGQSLGFFADGKLKRIPVQGGAAATLADVPAPRGGAWGSDDVIVMAPRDNTGLWRVSATGGTLEPATVLADGESSHRWPEVLPGGAGLMYTVWNGRWESSQIVVQPTDGSPRRVVVKGGGFGRFVPDDRSEQGYVLYAQPNIAAVPFDLSRLATTGPPVPVADGVITNFSGGAQFAVSSGGTFAYVPATSEPGERGLVWVDRTGAATPAVKVRGMSRWFDLSPDGLRVARYNNAGPARDVWVEDLSNHTSTPLTFRADTVPADMVDRLTAVWSADGRLIAYSAGTPPNLYRIPTDGSGGEERLTTSGNPQWAGSWSPDGRTLAFVELDPLSGSDIWLLTLDEAGKPRAPRALLRTPFGESAPMISPDGRWLAYQSNESGRYEIYVQPFPDGGSRRQLSNDEGAYPHWSPRGDELFFLSPLNRAGMTAVAVKPGPDFRTDPPRILYDARRYEAAFTPSPDASRFLMMPVLIDAPITQVNLVTNWLAGTGNRAR